MSSYILRYFPIPARAETCKALLALSGASWKLETPAWPQDKGAQPVGKIPVLIEAPDNSEAEPFVLGESRAIEEYIAAKYGLFYKPDDLQIMARQRELRSHITDMYETSAQIRFSNEATKPALVEKFKNISNYIIKFHEDALARNGSNGHYFGDKTTFVDVAMFASILALRSVFSTAAPDLLEIFSRENAPGISKVIDTLSAEPVFSPFLAGV
ncbi:hypothetical protein GGI25_003263 [Coemansia spiralis]|uniref:Glutathione S-transferase n=2 Tax=Coemansia TaxID=4863 RepID=A0A9W8KY82_9FUNG|nr:hypothetical protein BX070DRAFT_231165 [Coemansia spiralis]KAJ1989975.1 hypothetical protein EDC05_004326 [Coemansia umbellata]KAJ2621489.1 hypothetical protein GGI26_004068 [Coemansia sp. RSA 1358]KAJ2677167.1 hypothetical protein GGI25_003263 [Coemansia spiralis]